MSECRIERSFAIAAQSLGDDTDYGEEHAYEAVLEDGEPNNLQETISISTPIRHDEYDREVRDRTLNHVRPLLGMRKMPLSFPPVHFCRPKTPQNQFIGWT